MENTSIGARVGAILKTSGATVWLLGYGIYLGEQIPDPALGVTFFGAPVTSPNPAIVLDSGEVVYGCECWWGPVEFIQRKVLGYGKVIQVSIAEERKAPQTHERRRGVA
jgi:hypothetical protein